MNVGELMRMPLMKNAEVVAGKTGLYRDISWCAPDTALRFENWLMPGILCIFTGKNDKYGFDRVAEMITRHNPAGMLLFGMGEDDLGADFNAEFFNLAKLPLIKMPRGTNVLSFTKRIASVLSADFSEEYRSEEWLRELCLTEDFGPDETLAEMIGYSAKHIYRCCILRLKHTENEDILSIEMNMDRAKDFLAPRFAAKGYKFLSYIDRGTMVLFAAFERQDDVNGYSRSFINETVNKLKQQTGRKWVVSIGNTAENLAGFSTSYRNAARTASIIEALHVTSSINFYEDWYMHMLLLRESKADLYAYMMQSLAPLMDNDEYIETISDYLTFGENLKVTAEHLHIHVNTLKYRLQRIEELLSCDLKDPNVRFKLRMVITVYRYLKNNGSFVYT